MGAYTKLLDPGLQARLDGLTTSLAHLTAQVRRLSRDVEEADRAAREIAALDLELEPSAGWTDSTAAT